MKLMRAVTLKGYGGFDMLQNSMVPKAAIKADREVLIKVVAAGVNRADVSQRRGHYMAPPGASELLGLEVSGVVEEVGPSVTKFKSGDKVMALLSGGGYAEYATAHEGTVLPMPHGYSFIEAAAIPEAFLTAWQILKLHGDVQPGQNVLIHAGASGLGTAACQLTEKYFKSTAITTSSEAKVEVCKNFASINLSRTPDDMGLCFVPKVREVLGESSINVIVDPVFGGTYLAENGEVLAQDGKLIIVAFLGGVRSNFTCLPFFRKRTQIMFSKLRCQSDDYKEKLVSSFSKEVFPYLNERIITAVANKTFPLEEVAQAHQHVEDNNTWGKIVLSVTNNLK